jgi:hypothetical protein
VKRPSFLIPLLAIGLSLHPAFAGKASSSKKHSKENEEPYYNEVFDENGNIRPHYATVWPIYAGMSEKEQQVYQALTNKDFRGEYALHKIPRVLPQS